MASGFGLGTTTGGEPFVVDPRDLTTHAVIVGMTGSGKTGLGLVLLEEALSSGVPVLALDPKGDLGNLLLTFPDLSPASFEPWVEESSAREAGVSVAEHAAQVAAQWKDGLAAAGIGPERIKALRDTAELTIYTPGSSAGVPLNLVGSLQAPALSWETEAETLRDEIEGTVSSLLGLVGRRGRPAREPRARPALEPRRARLARRPEPRPRHADRRDPGTAAAQARRLRRRRLLPGRRSAPSSRCD